ncbi:ribonuclease H-like domain-containing protein [Tanacetum coccineum]
MTLLVARYMLLLKDSRLRRKQGREAARDTPSSSTVLLASGTSPNNKGRTNKEICRNFQRGLCRFADPCKFVHTRGSQNGKTSQWHSQGRLPARTPTVAHILTLSPPTPLCGLDSSPFHRLISHTRPVAFLD